MQLHNKRNKKTIAVVTMDIDPEQVCPCTDTVGVPCDELDEFNCALSGSEQSHRKEGAIEGFGDF